MFADGLAFLVGVRLAFLFGDSTAVLTTENAFADPIVESDFEEHLVQVWEVQVGLEYSRQLASGARFLALPSLRPRCGSGTARLASRAATLAFSAQRFRSASRAEDTITLGRNEATMRTRSWAIELAALLLLLTIAASKAHSQSMGGTCAPTAWGGYIVADPLPQQPVVPAQYGQSVPAYTLPGQVALPPQPGADPNVTQVWQTYPGAGGPVAGPATIGPPPTIISEPGYPAAPNATGPPSLLPPGTRSGVFQKAKFTATWLPQLEDDSIGWTDLKTEIVFGLPFFTRETPIVITPTYEAHFLNRPDGFDLPLQLHDLSIDFHHFRRVGDRWIADFALTPGLYADDHSLDSNDAFRLNGRAVGVYEPNAMWKWILGVTYVNGGWNKIVPVFGFVYEPSDAVDTKLCFQPPGPRGVCRIRRRRGRTNTGFMSRANSPARSGRLSSPTARGIRLLTATSGRSLESSTKS